MKRWCHAQQQFWWTSRYLGNSMETTLYAAMFLSLILPVGFHCCYKNKSTELRIVKSLCKSRVAGSSLSHPRLCSTLWACSKAITSGYVTLIFCVFIWNPTVITCPIFVVPNADPPTGICTSQSFEYKTRCTFTCLTGFRLKGSKERVCQFDKSWLGSPTICERMYTRKHIPCHKNYSSQHRQCSAPWEG